MSDPLVACLLEDTRWQALDVDALAEMAGRATLHHLRLEPSHFEIALLACDDARIATLNAEFREKPTPTNVLSWPETDLGSEIEGAVPEKPPHGGDEGPAHLGDIAIAYETCAREASDAAKPLSDHVTHLIVHGVLHLLGYDHIRDGDATLMERLETEILGKLGLPNPYRS